MKNTETGTVIVGAGMAGLTAAAYLTRANHPVLLLEKNDRIGGLVNTFDIDGFYFDSGPRAFVNSGMVKPILKDLGIAGDFLQNSISIGIEEHLFKVDALEALDTYRRILADLYPEDQLEIDKIVSLIKKLSDYTTVLYRFDNPNFVDFSGNIAYIFRDLLPWTIQLFYVLNRMKKYHQPVEEYLGQLTTNQSLIDILTQFFFRKTPADFALGYFTVYLDYFYPRDGTGALPRLLEEYLVEQGGEIQLNTEITAVHPGQSLVVDTAGRRYPYDHLIWAGDLKTLYRSLHLENLDAVVTERIEKKARTALDSKGGESSFILFLAVDRPPSYFKERGGEHLFFTFSRQGLGETIRGERLALLEDFEQRPEDQIWDWLEKFCRLNTYEVSIPALRDPSLAPEGQTGIMISCLFDYDVVKKIEAAGWYEDFKKRMEAEIIEVFSTSIYEGFAKDILFQISSTPLTIYNVVGSSEGAITGWSFENEIPVENQLMAIPKSITTPVPGVFQAGQWAYSPAGVPIAMLTGWHAAQNILKQSRRKRP